MKYNDKEQWILSEGMWYGLASCFFGFSVSIYQKIPPQEDSWIWGIILAIIFLVFGIYSNKKANKEVNK